MKCFFINTHTHTSACQHQIKKGQKKIWLTFFFSSASNFVTTWIDFVASNRKRLKTDCILTHDGKKCSRHFAINFLLPYNENKWVNESEQSEKEMVDVLLLKFFFYVQKKIYRKNGQFYKLNQWIIIRIQSDGIVGLFILHQHWKMPTRKVLRKQQLQPQNRLQCRLIIDLKKIYLSKQKEEQ